MKLILFTSLLAIFVAKGLGARRVICYFIDWAGYRQGGGKFVPGDIDYSKCTNVLYAFALLDSDSTTIKPADSWADISLNYYRDFVQKAKAAGSKPSLSLGGWNDSAGSKYSTLLNNPTKRQAFVKNVVNYLSQYGFEGLDIDYEYPACPQGDCSAQYAGDKQGFAQLLAELSVVFKPKGWVLSAAISGNPATIDKGYDVNAMNKYMDWIGVMTYDYNMPSQGKTGPVSPLSTNNGDSTDKSIKYLISKGADKSKLTIGVPFYGYSYKLQNPSNNGYWAASTGPGPAGQYTMAPGNLAYYEICQKLKEGYKNVEDKNLGAYAYSGDNWVSYNSRSDMINKMNYIKQNNLAGVIIWDLSTDDFKGQFCGQGAFPLLSAIKNNIG